jgi:hypothetical protein
VRCEVLRGSAGWFLEGRGSTVEGWPGLTPALMALTPLKTEGGGVKRGIKGGEMMAGW